MTRSDALSEESMGQQANAQGITWLAASGDSGAADCSSGPTDPTNSILSTDLPAGLPEVTGVGGTRFTEGSGQYWSATNNANGGSALSYIPETAWNDSAEEGTPSASGGGASMYFSKPSWQTGPGVPADGARDVPDVAFSASNVHDVTLTFTGGKRTGVRRNFGRRSLDGRTGGSVEPVCRFERPAVGAGAGQHQSAALQHRRSHARRFSRRRHRKQHHHRDLRRPAAQLPSELDRLFRWSWLRSGDRVGVFGRADFLHRMGHRDRSDRSGPAGDHVPR